MYVHKLLLLPFSLFRPIANGKRKFEQNTFTATGRKIQRSHKRLQIYNLQKFGGVMLQVELNVHWSSIRCSTFNANLVSSNEENVMMTMRLICS